MEGSHKIDNKVEVAQSMVSNFCEYVPVTRGVMVIVVENEYGDTSSNP